MTNKWCMLWLALPCATVGWISHVTNHSPCQTHRIWGGGLWAVFILCSNSAHSLALQVPTSYICIKRLKNRHDYCSKCAPSVEYRAKWQEYRDWESNHLFWYTFCLLTDSQRAKVVRPHWSGICFVKSTYEQCCVQEDVSILRDILR